MGFGRNPYVSKAQAAEQKAQEATDEPARARAYREAAHEWDRAAEREKPGKLRSEYEAHAVRNRDSRERKVHHQERAPRNRRRAGPARRLSVPQTNDHGLGHGGDHCRLPARDRRGTTG